ncbi:hypothetical protein AWB80_03562 [Caballeronia pedi]|uniref:Uncharacterized protein n=2 Tax=Caballeronia pedi TaxID=1777141 RepID=A0A158BH65_9BURK|nr:hypothetical protein AWB80_03562 [Caballeronia pedi]
MKEDFLVNMSKGAPVVGGNFWLWLSSHDINWWVAVATLAYIGSSFVFAWRKDRRAERACEGESAHG